MKKQVWVSKFSKRDLKNRKNEKMPKNSHFLGMFWCIRATKSVSPEFCCSCEVVFRSSFADQDGWDAEKSWNSVESVFFVSKMLTFHQITKFFGEKMCPY